MKNFFKTAKNLVVSHKIVSIVVAVALLALAVAFPLKNGLEKQTSENAQTGTQQKNVKTLNNTSEKGQSVLSGENTADTESGENISPARKKALKEYELTKKQFEEDKKVYTFEKVSDDKDSSIRYYRIINGMRSNEYYIVYTKNERWYHSEAYFSDEDIEKAKTIKFVSLDDKIKEIKETHSFDKDAKFFIGDMYFKTKSGKIYAIKDIYVDHNEFFHTHDYKKYTNEYAYTFDLSTGERLVPSIGLWDE